VLAEFTHPALYNDTPPLNLDGNFGCASAVVEMLVQSHRGELHVLPALPPDWREGEVRGLRARGGYTVSFAWKNQRLSWLEITADIQALCRVRLSLPLHHRSAVLQSLREGPFYCHEIPLKKGELVRLEARKTSPAKRASSRKSQRLAPHAKSTH
jgi:hypothetical protein